MSSSESADDLGNPQVFSRYEGLDYSSFENPISTEVEYSITRQSRVLPMAAAAEAKVALSGPDRLIFRLEK